MRRLVETFKAGETLYQLDRYLDLRHSTALGCSRDFVQRKATVDHGCTLVLTDVFDCYSEAERWSRSCDRQDASKHRAPSSSHYHQSRAYMHR